MSKLYVQPDVLIRTIDIGGASPASLDLGLGNYALTDSLSRLTNVTINGFGPGDNVIIKPVEGFDIGALSFGAQGRDLTISYSLPNSPNAGQIVITDILPDADALIYNYQLAVETIGYDFLILG